MAKANDRIRSACATEVDFYFGRVSWLSPVLDRQRLLQGVNIKYRSYCWALSSNHSPPITYFIFRIHIKQSVYGLFISTTIIIKVSTDLSVEFELEILHLCETARYDYQAKKD